MQLSHPADLFPGNERKNKPSWNRKDGSRHRDRKSGTGRKPSEWSAN